MNAPVPPPVVEAPKVTPQQSVFSFITGTMKVGRVAKSSRSKTTDPLTLAKDKVIKGIESQKALVKLVMEGKPLPKNGDKTKTTWFSHQSDGWWTAIKYGQLSIPLVADNTDILVSQKVDDLLPFYDAVIAAVRKGELDSQIGKLQQERSKALTKKDKETPS